MIIDSITNDAPTTCSVAWEISNKCNYSCWYCPEYLHSGTSGWPDFQKTLDFFNVLSQKNEYVHVSILGGEPTLWPELGKFLEKMPENIFADIVTNGSRTMGWWEKIKPYLTRHRVILSFHADTAKEEHILSVAKLLKSSDIVCYILFLLDPKHEKRLNAFAEVLKENEITYTFKALFPKFGDVVMDYTEEQKNTIVNNAFVSDNAFQKIYRPREIIINDDIKIPPAKLMVEKLNNFFGFSCMVGSKRFHINPEQEIFAGSCRMVKLGTLSNYKLLTKPVICKRTSCTCLDDIRTFKWRNL